MTSQVVPLGASEDPCREVTCAAHSYCRVEADERAGCVCNPGFEEDGRDRASGCVDIDECALGQHDCAMEADCVNQQGSFGCVCRPGYVGNGQECFGKWPWFINIYLS